MITGFFQRALRNRKDETMTVQQNSSGGAQRIINTITGPWERKYLPRMAKALPGWVTPDHLTLLGLFAALLIMLGYLLLWESSWWIMIVNSAWIVHWFGDSLDGTLARVRGIERERYGYFVDHIADAVTAVLFGVGLGLSPLMHIPVALLLIVLYFLLTIYVHIQVYTRGVFQISFGRFGPTELRILIILLNTVFIFWNPAVGFIFQIPFTAMDIGGLVLALSGGISFIRIVYTEARALNQLDATRMQRQNKTPASPGTDRKVSLLKNS